ncbi:MAG: hypothetical protein KFW07_03165 [Mycoplasmataceae bacterium]|nr:hypothetical protein [Mycoplasmataceae bacterium]
MKKLFKPLVIPFQNLERQTKKTDIFLVNKILTTGIKKVSLFTLTDKERKIIYDKGFNIEKIKKVISSQETELRELQKEAKFIKKDYWKFSREERINIKKSLNASKNETSLIRDSLSRSNWKKYKSNKELILEMGESGATNRQINKIRKENELLVRENTDRGKLQSIRRSKTIAINKINRARLGLSEVAESTEFIKTQSSRLIPAEIQKDAVVYGKIQGKKPKEITFGNKRRAIRLINDDIEALLDTQSIYDSLSVRQRIVELYLKAGFMYSDEVIFWAQENDEYLHPLFKEAF